MPYIYWVIVYSTFACLALSSAIVLWKYKVLEVAMKTFGLYLITNFIIEGIAFSLAMQEANNNLLVHLFTLLEFIFLSFFYFKIIKKPAFFQTLLKVLAPIVVIYIIGNTLFVQGIDQINSYSETVENVLIISFAIFYFYRVLLEPDPLRIRGQALNLINSGLILYLSGSLFIFMFSPYILKSAPEAYIPFFIFNSLLNLISKILFLIAMIKIGFSKAEPPTEPPFVTERWNFE